MGKLKDKTLFITGASRGIGRSIALRCAQDGANVVIVAKTDEPHPKLSGTIHTVAAEVEAAGGQALALKVDIRDNDAVLAAARQAADHFGGIDVLVNNASAIQLTPLQKTDMKRYDLIQSINSRGVMVCSQAVIPFLKQSDHGQILSLSPPINLNKHWLKPFIPYTLSKYGMTLLTLGLAEELREDGIAANTLWPQTGIATAAIEFAVDPAELKSCRTPDIMADAAYEILASEKGTLTGETLVDEPFLRSRGYTEFDHYKFDPNSDKLMRDFFLDD